MRGQDTQEIDIRPALIEHHEQVISKMATEITYLKSRQLVPVSPEMVRDDLGMTPEHWRQMCWECDREMLSQRWKALKAIWGKPVKSSGRGYSRDLCEDVTLLDRLVATVAVVLDRSWSDRAEARWKRRLSVPFIHGNEVCFWDSHQGYFGWSNMALRVYPGFRVEIYSDGE